MAGSVRGAVEQPKYTLSSILQGLRSPKGSKTLWVVVEDNEDKAFYEKFSNLNTSRIKTSEDENGYKGCEKLAFSNPKANKSQLIFRHKKM